MSVNPFGVFLVIVYYITVLYVGVMSGRKINLAAGAKSKSRGSHSRSRWKKMESEDRYLLNLFLADRSLDIFVGATSLTGGNA